MYPTLIKIGHISIYSYGVMVAAGFGISIYLASLRTPLFGVRKDDLLDCALYILIGGLAGARLLYVALNFGYFKARPLEIFYLSQGGLAYYGAFLGGIAAGVIYVLKSGISFWDTADLLAPYIALGQSIGRIGCLLNGCCYGRPVSDDFPFKVYFPQDHVARHPTQVYSSLILLALFAVLSMLQERRRFSGEIFLAYVFAYSFQRYFIEFLRGDNPAVVFGMTTSQLMSVLFFALSFFIYRKYLKRWKNTQSL